MANDIKLTTDAAVTGLKELEHMKQLIIDSDRASGRLKTTLDNVSRIMKSMESVNLRQLNQGLRMLSMGSPVSAINTAVSRGNISAINAQPQVLAARETNAIFKAHTEQLKALNHQLKMGKSQGFRTDMYARNPEALRAQLGIARYAQSSAVNAANAAGMDPLMDKRYQEVTRWITRAEEKLRLMKDAERQITEETRQRLRLQERIGTITDKIALKEAEIQAAKGNASRLEIAQLQVQRQQLAVQEAFALSNGKTTAEVQKQLNLLQQMRAQRSQIAKEEGVLRQREARSNLISDGGASLFKVQASLMANYLLMGQLFNLFNFGRQYVVELDATFRDLQAIITATDTGMESLKQTIIDVSQETRFSAIEVAEAAKLMGQAGLSLEQIEKSIGAVTLLATATGTDLVKSVEVATSVMSVFNLRAEEMTHISNVLTGALNLSKLDIDKLALGIQYAGNVAADSGARFEELVAALGAISNAGIKSGSTMGTGLRQLLTEILDPSAKFLKILNDLDISITEIDVRSQGLTQVFRNLKDAGFTTGEAFKALDIRAAAAYSALSKNLDLADKMEQSFLLTNAAAEANNVQMKSLSATVSQFTNVLGLSINSAWEPLAMLLRDIIKYSTGVLKFFNDLGYVIPGITMAITGMVAAAAGKHFTNLLGNLLFGGVTIAEGTKQLTAARAALVALGATGSRLMTLFKASLPGLAAGAVLAVASGFGSSAGAAADEVEKLKANLESAQGAWSATQGKIDSVQSAIGTLVDRYGSLSKNHGLLETEAIRLQTQFGEMGVKIDHNALSVDGLISSLRELRVELKAVSEEQARFTAGQVVAQLANQTATAKDRNVNVMSLGVGGPLAMRERMLGARTNLSTASTPQEIAKSAQDYRAFMAAIDKELAAKSESLARAAQAIKDGSGDKASYDKLNFEIGQLQLLKGRSADILRNITDLALAMGIAADIMNSNAPAVEAMNVAVEEAKIRLDEIREALNSKTLDPQTRAAMEAEMSEIMKLLGAGTVEAFTKLMERFVPELLAKIGLGDAQEQLGVNASSIGAVAEAVKVDAENANERIVKQLDASYQQLVAKHNELIEKAGRQAQEAADRLGVDAARYGYIEKESAAGGGLHGTYSEGQLAVMRRKQRELEIQQLEKELEGSRARVATMSAAYGQRAGAYSRASQQAGSNPNDPTDSVLLAQRKDLESLRQQLEAERNRMRDLENKIDPARGRATEQGAGYWEQASQAVVDYAEEAGWALQTLDNQIYEMTQGTLDAATSAFGEFFRSVFDGTKSVGDAFKDMAKSILSSMLDMVTQMMAKQALGGIFGLLGGGSGGGGIISSLLGSLGGGGMVTGGPIRAAAGRAIPQRDSVHVFAQPGEFLMRKTAVDAIGIDNLAAMNAYGNRTISASQSGVAANLNGGPKVTNVYVVMPEEKPTLGKNDVLAIVSDDMLKGGQTKKLIKQVVQE